MIIEYLSVTIIFVSIANVVRTQYLIPREMDNIYIKSTFCGAVVNLIANLILIPKFSAIGAAIGTILAELTVMCYQIIKVRKEIPIIEYLKNSMKFLIKAVLMFGIVISLRFVVREPITLLVIQVLVGILVYAILNYRYITEKLNLKQMMIRKVKQ